jgi:Flp pilus assembly protein TadD
MGIALAQADQGSVAAARGLAGEAARMLHRSGDRPGLSAALNNLAVIEIISGQYGRAVQVVEKLLSLRAVPDFHRSIGWSHLLLAQLRERTGDSVGAEAAVRAAATVFRRIGEQQGLAAVAYAATTR